MDSNFKKAITVFSTSVMNLNKDVQIDFYGSKINDKLLKKFGNIKLEDFK